MEGGTRIVEAGINERRAKDQHPTSKIGFLIKIVIWEASQKSGREEIFHIPFPTIDISRVKPGSPDHGVSSLAQ